MNPPRLLTVLVILTAVFVVRARRLRHARHAHAHAASDTLSVRQEFNLRQQQLGNWTCNIPKPRLVYLDDPTNDNGFVAEPNILWVPVVAVLHRCDQSTGCCSNHPRFTCKDIERQTVRMLFRRVDMLRGSDSYQRFEFKNHTRCDCVPTNPRATEL